MNMPGKFEACDDQLLAQGLYQHVQDGWINDQAGSVSENGVWIGLLESVPFTDDNPDDGCHSYIVHEDDQGFFTYKEYSTVEEAREKFANIAGRI